MIHFDSCFLLEGCQDPHKSVLKCLKWVNPESVAVASRLKDWCIALGWD